MSSFEFLNLSIIANSVTKLLHQTKCLYHRCRLKSPHHSGQLLDQSVQSLFCLVPKKQVIMVILVGNQRAGHHGHGHHGHGHHGHLGR